VIKHNYHFDYCIIKDKELSQVFTKVHNRTKVRQYNFTKHLKNSAASNVHNIYFALAEVPGVARDQM
jgi:hypothetical protein